MASANCFPTLSSELKDLKEQYVNDEIDHFVFLELLQVLISDQKTDIVVLFPNNEGPDGIILALAFS